LLRPPYLFLVLLQSSVFGLITTPLFLVLLRDPVVVVVVVVVFSAV
jgi:hypothetical protein